MPVRAARFEALGEKALGAAGAITVDGSSPICTGADVRVSTPCSSADSVMKPGSCLSNFRSACRVHHTLVSMLLQTVIQYCHGTWQGHSSVPVRGG